MRAIAARAETLRAFSYRGEVENLDTKERFTFQFRLQQPNSMRAEIPAAQSIFNFDGTVLTVVEGATQRVLRQDLSKKDPATLLSTLHQLFESYTVEGWRAPMMRTEQSAVGGSLTTDDEGPLWQIFSQLEDEGVREVRYTLRPPQGAFVSKVFLGREGQVLSQTRVTDNHRDPSSGLVLPRVWEHQDARGRYRVSLTEIQVNEVGPANGFRVEVPAGFTVQEF